VYKRLLALGLGVVLAVGVATLVGKGADYAKLLDELEQVTLWWLPLCLLGEALRYLGYILAYRDVARVKGGPRLDYWMTTRIAAVGFGAFVVGAAAGGLAVNYWALRKAKARRHTAIARVLALNTLQWAVLAVGAVAAAIALLLGAAEGAPLAMTLPWLIVVPIAVAAAAWVSSPHRSERLTKTRRERGIFGGARRLFADAVRGVVLVRELLANPRACAAGVLGFPLYWAGDLLCLWAALRAFGESVPLSALILGYATGYVATALPLPAGGAGGVDAALTFSLHAVGVPLAPALLGVFLYRLFNFWLPLVPAFAALPTVNDLSEELRRVPR
jgi:uncharacterized membrane protein YbhN (UPF0104 family)